MTNKELELIQRLGCSSYTIFQFMKNYPRSTNNEVAFNLGLTYETSRRTIAKLESFNVIKRSVSNNNTREVEILKESDWDLQ